MKKIKVIWEKCYPIFMAVVLAGVIICCEKRKVINFSILIGKLSDNALSLSVTFLGFLLTILTIINSIDTRRMRFIRTGGLYPRLLSYLRNAIVLNLFLIAFSFGARYLDYRTIALLTVGNYNIIDCLYLWFFCWTLLSSYRFTKIFVSLLSDPNP